MSQNLAELLELLVEDLYGSLASTVLATLARHGRLTLYALTQSSGLSPRLAKHGLVILIQQHLVFHHVERRDGLTYYEADLAGCYALVRSGRILELVRAGSGETGERIVTYLLNHGHASVGEVVAATAPDSIGFETAAGGAINGSGLTNGASNGRHEVQNQKHRLEHGDGHLKSVIHKLKNAEILETVTANSFASDADIEAVAFYTARQSMPDHKAPRGKKEKERHDKLVHTLKRQYRDIDVDDYKEEQSASKRQKTNGIVNGIKLQESAVLKLNREKINVLIRAQQLADLAARAVGETSARVYKLLLDAMAERQHRCFEQSDEPPSDNESDVNDETDPVVTCADLVERIPPELDISRGIAAEEPFDMHSPDTRHENHRHRSEVYGLDDTTSASLLTRSIDENVIIAQLARHLDVLAASGYQFVHRVGNAGGGQYRVDFEELCTALVQLEIEDHVTSRFGNEAARLVRILARKGKLDEKQLSVLSLIRSREVKGLLLELQQAGFVDLQEVPRDAGRVPSRTIYLYFFDRDRVRRKLLDDTYKVMARLLQRSKVERERLRLVIEKAERTDVQGHEDKYLTAAEREDLARWTEREERLLVALGRCDDVVAALRDFLPGSVEP